MPKNESLPNCVWALAAATFVLASSAVLASAQGQTSTSSRIPWKTGPERERQLSAVLTIRWSSNPLRQALTRLSTGQQVAILLDRRVDPDQQIEFSSQGVDLRQFLEGLARQLGQGVSHVGPVVYIGPKETASVLATVTMLREQEAQSLPSAVRSRLKRATPLRWPELTTPRDLIAQLAAGTGMHVEGVEQIPHDLWPEADLPPLTFAQRMSLVLAGFQLTFRYSQDGSTIRLEPIEPETAVLKRTYTPRVAAANVVASLARRYPNANITTEAGKVTVIGTVEEHDAIKRTLEGRPERSTPAKRPAVGRKVLSGRISGLVGSVASGLAKQMSLQVEFDPRVQDKLNQLVSYDAKDATLEEILDALFAPVGLSYELTDKTLRVIPRESP